MKTPYTPPPANRSVWRALCDAVRHLPMALIALTVSLSALASVAVLSTVDAAGADQATSAASAVDAEITDAAAAVQVAESIPVECGTALNSNVLASTGMVDYRDTSTGLGTQCGEAFKGKMRRYYREWKQQTPRDPNRWYGIGEFINAKADEYELMYGNEWGLAMAWFRDVNEDYGWNMVSHCYMTDRNGRFGALYRERWLVGEHPSIRYDQMVVRADIYNAWQDAPVIAYIKVNFPPCAVNGAA